MFRVAQRGFHGIRWSLAGRDEGHRRNVAHGRASVETEAYRRSEALAGRAGTGRKRSMTSDLKQKERTVATPQRTATVTSRRTWPYVLAAVVLAVVVAVVVAVGMLAIAQDEPVATYQDLNTAVREGSGYAQVEDRVFPDLITDVREGPGSEVKPPPPKGSSTEVRGGSRNAKAPEPGTVEAWQG
jgi:hypothetical protein